MIGHFVDSGGKIKHGNIAADEPLDALALAKQEIESLKREVARALSSERAAWSILSQGAAIHAEIIEQEVAKLRATGERAARCVASCDRIAELDAIARGAK